MGQCHGITTLSHKPGTVSSAEALRQAPEGIRRVFCGAFEKCPKDFVGLLLFARDRGLTYEDVTDSYDRLKKSRVREVTLTLMKAALMPEKSCTLAATVMLLQDGGAIERRAGEGLRMAAQMMMTTVKATNYGAAE